MTDAPPISLDPASSSDSSLLANLLELYIHDLSEIFPVELRADGRFGYDKLLLYWSEPERRFPFLILCADRVIGFALITRGSPVSDDPNVFDIAEFFILRRYRRTGAGRQAAFLLWNRMPGSWIVRVSEANRSGLPFWSRVTSEYTSSAVVESHRSGNPHDWRVFAFESKAMPTSA